VNRARSSAGDSTRATRRLWILALVPSTRHGRLQSAALILLTLLVVFWLTGAFELPTGGDEPSWPAALFFCAILAYITPVFHLITCRTEDDFADLSGQLDLPRERLAALSARIREKPLAWVLANLAIGLSAWLLQSWLLLGSVAAMTNALTSSLTELAMALGPLPVWLFMSCAIQALIDNARLFRRLAGSVEVNLLDPTSLHPFGRMAVSSTLVVIGAQALFPIMWLDADTDPWTTIPGLLATTVAMVFLFLAPVWPIHRAVRRAKRQELERIRQQIAALARAGGEPSYPALAPLLTYRREIAAAPEWPFDLSIVARFGLYLIIVPLTWIGAAVIERLVDTFLG
jgi:hypothetical protein